MRTSPDMAQRDAGRFTDACVVTECEGSGVSPTSYSNPAPAEAHLPVRRALSRESGPALGCSRIADLMRLRGVQTNYHGYRAGRLLFAGESESCLVVCDPVIFESARRLLKWLAHCDRSMSPVTRDEVAMVATAGTRREPTT